MRHHRRFSTAAAPLLALAIVACSDAVTGPITLNAADTKLLYQELETVFSRAELDRSGVGVVAATPGMVLDRQTTVALTVNCSGGGSANFSGTDNSSPAAAVYDVSVTFNQCQTDHYQLSGNYHQTISNNTTGTATSIATTGTGDITVKVLSSGSAGSCHIDFSLTVASGGVTAAGSFCGSTASGTLTS